MNYQTMLGDKVVHADQNSSKSERASMNGTGYLWYWLLMVRTGYGALILKVIRPCTSGSGNMRLGISP